MCRWQAGMAFGENGFTSAAVDTEGCPVDGSVEEPTLGILG